MEAWEYSFIKREILALTDINLDFYKSTQMQRRLKTFLIRSGHTNWRNYFQDARCNPMILSQLKDYLTINVSAFFRDMLKYQYLRQHILPGLLQHRSKLRIWSAGCSRGQEPFSIAMLLAEKNCLHQGHYILATDLDQAVLEQARAGGPYTEDEVKDIPAASLQRFFEKRAGYYWVQESFRRQVTFRRHNLLADPFENEFDLIICRNVVIYFTNPVKDQLYRKFYNALSPNGILFVGGTEIVPKAADLGFETAGISFYRRNGRPPQGR